MDIAELQQRLANQGCYDGNVDGIAGEKTYQGVLKYLTDGTDDPLQPADFEDAAGKLGVPVSYVKALYEVESTGQPFMYGRPVILFEPHRFWKATKGRFGYTDFSYPTWDPKKYPVTQTGRYAQLVQAVMADPLAGFASASYGGFQILGENYARCGCVDSMAFAWQESQTAADQLHHFVQFVKTDTILHRALVRGDWVMVARNYNGTAYYKNRYDVRLAQAQRKAELAG